MEVDALGKEQIPRLDLAGIKGTSRQRGVEPSCPLGLREGNEEPLFLQHADDVADRNP